MVSDFYGTLLQELSQVLEIETLEPDENNTCLIKFINELEVQIEPDKREDYLLLVTNFGQIPPGGYRDDLFRLALKANALPYPRHGTFAYSQKADHLVLYEQLHLKDLTGQKVADALDPFMAKANAWNEALKSNSLPEVKSAETEGGSGLFGLVR